MGSTTRASWRVKRYSYVRSPVRSLAERSSIGLTLTDRMPLTRASEPPQRKPRSGRARRWRFCATERREHLRAAGTHRSTLHNFAIRYCRRGDLPLCPKARRCRRRHRPCRRARTRGRRTGRRQSAVPRPRPCGQLLEVVAVAYGGGEIVIHAMRMRSKYEPFLRGEGDS